MLGKMKKIGMFALALTLVVTAFAGITTAWTDEGITDIEDNLNHTATYVDSITLDGENTDGEYDDAMTVTQWYDEDYINFPNSTLHYSWTVTDDNLYLWADITSDNTTGGYLEAIIDFNDDGSFDSEDGDLYLKVEMNETEVVELNYTYGSETVDGTAAFTDSVWSETDHMQFEFEFPLAILNETNNYSAYSLEGYGTAPTWGYPAGSSITSFVWDGIGEWENATANFGESAYVLYTDDDNVHVQGYILDDEGNETTDANFDIKYMFNFDGTFYNAYINESFYEFDFNATECFGVFIVYEYTDTGEAEFYKISWEDITPGETIELNYTINRSQFDVTYTINGTISDSVAEIDGTSLTCDVIAIRAPNNGWGWSQDPYGEPSGAYVWDGTDCNETGFYEISLPNGTWKLFYVVEDHAIDVRVITIDENETLDVELETFEEWKSERVDTYEYVWDDWLNATVETNEWVIDTAQMFEFILFADITGNWDEEITTEEWEHWLEFYLELDVYELGSTMYLLDWYKGDTNYTQTYDILEAVDWVDFDMPVLETSGTIEFDGVDVNASADNHTIALFAEDIYSDYSFVIPYENQIANVTVFTDLNNPYGGIYIEGTEKLAPIHAGWTEIFDTPFTSTPATRNDEDNFTVSSVGDSVYLSIEDYADGVYIVIQTIPIDFPNIGLVDLELEEGHNLITFPYGTESQFTMYDIIAQEGVISMTYRDAEGIYHTILRDGEEFFGLDQDIEPNTGYYVVVEEDVEIDIVTDGEYKSLAGMELTDGWNFIGITEYEGAMTISEIFNYTLGTALAYHDGTEYKNILLSDPLSYTIEINPGEAFWLFMGEDRRF